MRREKLLLMAWLVVSATALPGCGWAISANDDVTVRGSTVYDEVDAYAGIVWFGLFANGTNDRAYTEFTLGTVPATSATLSLYEYWEGGLIGNPGVDGTTTIKGAVASFDESDNSAASLSDGSWPALGSFGISLGNEIGFYNVDITSFYNANLGETVTFAIRFAGSGAPGSGDGPIFEDRELTAFWGGISSEADGAPLLNVEEIPEPTCLLLLAGGLCVLPRRRKG